MFSATSHSYFLQLAALWCSFVPAIMVLALVTGAQLEQSRRLKPVRARANAQYRR